MSNPEPQRASSGGFLLAVALTLLALVPVGVGGSWHLAHWQEIVQKDQVPDLKPITATETVTRWGSPGKSWRIAISQRVVHDEYDDIADLLAKMGSGYPYTRIKLGGLVDSRLLSGFDILFLGCAAEMAPAVVEDPNMQLFTTISMFKYPGYTEKVKAALRKFVEDGGSIYASDWASTYLEEAFPEFVSFSDERYPKQQVKARVLDPGLAEIIGKVIDLRFDKDLWGSVQSVTRGKVYIEGEVRGGPGRMEVLPLVVGFPVGKGQVVYTSFHNETPQDRSAELTQEQRGLLEYLVFKQVTRAASGQAAKILVSQNYALSKETLFSTGVGAAKEFGFIATPGQKLSFILGWTNPPEGEAILELSVTSPGGKQTKQSSGMPPIVIPVDGAEGGAYSYSVNSRKAPFNNFPYVVQVGVK